jgi:hypothetical protein
LKKLAIVDLTGRSLPYDYYYIKALSKAYKIEFYCGRSKFNRKFYELLKNIDNVSLVSRSAETGYVLSILKCYFSLFINAYKYDYINLQWTPFPWLWLPFVYSFKRKVIITVHNDSPHNSEEYSRCSRILFKMSGKLIFPSYSVSRSFFLNNNLPNLKYTILQHGVMPVREDSRKLPPKKEFTGKIAFWGTVKPYKGVDIFELCDSVFLNNYEVTIAGKFDESMRYIKESLPEQIKVIDSYVEPEVIEDLLYNNSAFVLPYRKATQSGVMYTLLNYGVPFVCSGGGDPEEFLCRMGYSELCFEVGDISGLQDSLKFLENNYSEIVFKLEQIRDQYYWDSNVDDLSDFIAGL